MKPTTFASDRRCLGPIGSPSPGSEADGCPGLRRPRARSRGILALTILALATSAVLLAAGPAVAQTTSEAIDPSLKDQCFGPDSGRRVTACTSLLTKEPLSRTERSLAYAMRALAHSIRGDYALALPDYDRAIDLRPNFPIALNNRAWALYQSGQIDAGLADVARALTLSPASSHALDTRAHLHQAQGNVDGAMRDYRKAMRFGGQKMVRLYQCGLQAAGLYSGPLSGIVTRDLIGALESCVRNKGCDPLPADEECRKLTS